MENSALNPGYYSCVFLFYRGELKRQVLRGKKEKIGHPLFPAGIFMGVLIFFLIFSDFLS